MRVATRVMAAVVMVLGVLYLQYIEPMRWGVMLLALGPVVWWYGDTMHGWRRRADKMGCGAQMGLILQALLLSAALVAVMVWMMRDVLGAWL